MPVLHSAIHKIDKKPDGTPAVLFLGGAEQVESQARDLKIRTKAVLVDAKKKPILNPKTGAPKVGFSDWAPEASYAA